MSTTQLILVCGFLGAGKTTLLARAASVLLGQGKRVGLITNDQAADLVDTTLLRQAKLEVQEIAGGCSCCRFGELVDTVQGSSPGWHPMWLSVSRSAVAPIFRPPCCSQSRICMQAQFVCRH